MTARTKEQLALIRDRLAKLRETYGKLTPAIVVADARDETSPLHHEFDWDVDRLVEAALYDRAREIIRSVRVEITTDDVTVSYPAYVRDPRAAAEEQGYESVVILRDDPTYARIALLYEARRAVAALQRARDVAGALGLLSDIDEILKNLGAVMARVNGDDGQ